MTAGIGRGVGRKPRTPLEHVLAAGTKRMQVVQAELFHAADARSHARVVAAFKAQAKVLTALHVEVSRTSAASHVERQAKPLVLSALGHASRACEEMHAASVSGLSDPTGAHSAERLAHYATAQRLFGTGEAAGRHARTLLGCDDFCQVLT